MMSFHVCREALPIFCINPVDGYTRCYMYDNDSYGIGTTLWIHGRAVDYPLCVFCRTEMNCIEALLHFDYTKRIYFEIPIA